MSLQVPSRKLFSLDPVQGETRGEINHVLRGRFSVLNARRQSERLAYPIWFIVAKVFLALRPTIALQFRLDAPAGAEQVFMRFLRVQLNQIA